MHGKHFYFFGWRLLSFLLISLAFMKAAPGQNFAVTSADGQLQVVLPSEWEKANLHAPGSQIQASNSAKQMYLVVSSIDRADAVGTLDDYARFDLQNAAHRLGEASISAPRQSVAGGRRCIQYRVHAILPKAQVRIAYLLTFMQTERHYIKIAGWTAESRFEANVAQLSQIAENVVEANQVEANQTSQWTVSK